MRYHGQSAAKLCMNVRIIKEGHMNKIEAFTNEQLKKELPVIRIGDSVRVHNRIKEGNRERIQLFEGTVIAKHGG